MSNEDIKTYLIGLNKGAYSNQNPRRKAYISLVAKRMPLYIYFLLRGRKFEDLNTKDKKNILEKAEKLSSFDGGRRTRRRRKTRKN